MRISAEELYELIQEEIMQDLLQEAPLRRAAPGTAPKAKKARVGPGKQRRSWTSRATRDNRSRGFSSGAPPLPIPTGAPGSSSGPPRPRRAVAGPDAWEDETGSATPEGAAARAPADPEATARTAAPVPPETVPGTWPVSGPDPEASAGASDVQKKALLLGRARGVKQFIKVYSRLVLDSGLPPTKQTAYLRDLHTSRSALQSLSRKGQLVRDDGNVNVAAAQAALAKIYDFGLGSGFDPAKLHLAKTIDRSEQLAMADVEDEKHLRGTRTADGTSTPASEPPAEPDTSSAAPAPADDLAALTQPQVATALNQLRAAGALRPGEIQKATAAVVQTLKKSGHRGAEKDISSVTAVSKKILDMLQSDLGKRTGMTEWKLSSSEVPLASLLVEELQIARVQARWQNVAGIK
jgi:hypothetical protein